MLRYIQVTKSSSFHVMLKFLCRSNVIRTNSPKLLPSLDSHKWMDRPPTDTKNSTNYTQNDVHSVQWMSNNPA